jgi:hypothetical protein
MVEINYLFLTEQETHKSPNNESKNANSTHGTDHTLNSEYGLLTEEANYMANDTKAW